ncbi:MAG: oligosaccharide flippase family protein [Candidatus Krumholzibacteriia bacterium]
MLSQSIYIFASKIAGYTIRILLPIFLVRVLTQLDYGIYRQFFLIEATIATLFQFGINQSLFYFVPRDEGRAPSYLANTILLNFAAYGLAFGLVTPFRHELAAWLNMVPLVENYVELVVYTVALMLTIAGDCYLCARKRIRQSAAFEIGGQLLVSAATLTAAFTTRSVPAVILAMVAGRLLHLALMAGYIHLRLGGLRGAQPFYRIWTQVRYGLVLGLGGSAWSLSLRIHPLIISKGLGVEAFAVYSVGITELPVVQAYLQSLAAVALGRFAVLEKAGDWDAIRRLWRDILAAMLGVVVPFVVVLTLLAEPLVILLFTEQYADAVGIFRVNTLMKLSMIWNAQLVLRAIDRNDVTLKIYGAQLAVSPFLLWGMLQLWGMIGVIAGQAAIQIAGRLACQAALNRITGERLPYLVSPREILAYYRTVGRRLAQKLRRGRSDPDATRRPPAAGEDGRGSEEALR